MGFADVRQTLIRDFVQSVPAGHVPPLETYFQDFVREGEEAAASDYRLVPLTPPGLRLRYTSSNCLTDCMLELQSRYRQFVPSDWGGQVQKGWRDLGVIGFSILEGPELEIVEINTAEGFAEWAQPKRQALAWDRLLIRAVLDFAQASQVRQVRLQPAKNYAMGSETPRDPARLAEIKATLEQRYDGSATAMGFIWNETLDCFVRKPARAPTAAN